MVSTLLIEVLNEHGLHETLTRRKRAWASQAGVKSAALPLAGVPSNKPDGRPLGFPKQRERDAN